MATAPEVGKNIDSWCTKCKMMLAHTIIAVVAGKPKKVQCNTCDGAHAYKANPPGTRKKTTRKKTTKRVSAEEQAQKDFDALVAEHDISQALKYAMSAVYEVGGVIDHKNFGIGIITEVREGSKISVVFKEGAKVLVHER